MSACAWLFVAVLLLFIAMATGLGLYMRAMESRMMIPKRRSKIQPFGNHSRTIS
jgi:hypothetical protein